MPKQLNNRYALVYIQGVTQERKSKIIGPYYEDEDLSVTIMHHNKSRAVCAITIEHPRWEHEYDSEVNTSRLMATEIRVPVVNDNRFIDITFDEDTGEHVIRIKTGGW